MEVEGLLEPLLCSKGSDCPQALKRRGQVGEDWTPSCREDDKAHIMVVVSLHSVHDMSIDARTAALWDTHWWTRGV